MVAVAVVVVRVARVVRPVAIAVSVVAMNDSADTLGSSVEVTGEATFAPAKSLAWTVVYHPTYGELFQQGQGRNWVVVVVEQMPTSSHFRQCLHTKQLRRERHALGCQQLLGRGANKKVKIGREDSEEVPAPRTAPASVAAHG